MRARRYAFALAVPLVPLLQLRLERSRGPGLGQEGQLYLRSGAAVRRLAPGFDQVLADVYWLRTVQYFGHQVAFARDKRFDLLLPLVDITTTLDPRFEMAYRYGATFLAEPYPRGAGQPDAAVALLERGVRENPSSWRLRQDLGTCHFFYRHDSSKAAAVLNESARLPGAPFWLETMAAEFLYKGGERETSRRLWERLYEAAEEDFQKSNALFNLRHLDALDVADRLERFVERFAAQHGRRPVSLEELRTAGTVRDDLTDPSGAPFDYDPATGRVTIARASGLWRPE